MQKHRREETPSEVSLPITPMLDMAFQLMFFFIATFNPIAASEGEVDLSLPSKSASVAQDQKKVDLKDPTHKEEIDDKAELTISLRGYQDARNKGLVSAVTVKTTAGEEAITGTPDEREKKLREKLLAALPSEDEKAENKKGATVRIEAESDVRWSEVMRFVDIARKPSPKDRRGFQVSFAKPLQGGE